MSIHNVPAATCAAASLLSIASMLAGISSDEYQAPQVSSPNPELPSGNFTPAGITGIFRDGCGPLNYFARHYNRASQTACPMLGFVFVTIPSGGVANLDNLARVQ